MYEIVNPLLKVIEPFYHAFKSPPNVRVLAFKAWRSLCDILLGHSLPLVAAGTSRLSLLLNPMCR
jgi:hypothetical protein